MLSHSPDDEPLKELKHDAVPGYFKAFVIAFVVMGLYLAILLVISPGPAKKYDYSGGGKSEATD